MWFGAFVIWNFATCFAILSAYSFTPTKTSLYIFWRLPESSGTSVPFCFWHILGGLALRCGTRPLARKHLRTSTKPSLSNWNGSLQHQSVAIEDFYWYDNSFCGTCQGFTSILRLNTIGFCSCTCVLRWVCLRRTGTRIYSLRSVPFLTLMGLFESSKPYMLHWCLVSP